MQAPFLNCIAERLQCSLGERDGKDGVTLRRFVEVDRATVLLRDLLGKGKAESDSALPSFADEGQKQRMANRLRHPRPIVGNENMDELIVLPQTDCYSRLPTAEPCGLAGVQQQIVDSSAQLSSIDPGRERR